MRIYTQEEQRIINNRVIEQIKKAYQSMIYDIEVYAPDHGWTYQMKMGFVKHHVRRIQAYSNVAVWGFRMSELIWESAERVLSRFMTKGRIR